MLLTQRSKFNTRTYSAAGFLIIPKSLFRYSLGHPSILPQYSHKSCVLFFFLFEQVSLSLQVTDLGLARTLDRRYAKPR